MESCGADPATAAGALGDRAAALVEEPMTPAPELRAAADTLDRAADKATPGEWQVAASWAGPNAVLNSEGHPIAVCGDDAPGYEFPIHDAAFIAVMDPALAKTVAAWLRATAPLLRISHERCDHTCPHAAALAVARAVNKEVRTNV
jgi:hypothetical protein